MILSDLWYKNGLIYCVDVRAFLDANGDGIGDFTGLTRRLDYLAGLGVTCLWLLPFQPSPRRDDGYDIADYYGIDPRFGTLGDFVQFMNEAKQRSIRVIVDLVVNHTSNEHPWFQSARHSKRSPFRNWYVWSKTCPEDADTGMAFPGVQKTTWTFDKQAGEWYFHRFYEFQPDLNTESPEVQAEIRKIMGFWLELGVSGFRMDAVPFVIAAKGAGKAIKESYGMLRDLRLFLQWRRGDAILLGEANVLPQDDLEYFGDRDDRMHMMFNFQANQHLFYALATRQVESLAKALTDTKLRPETAQWANFLRNNDELDLGRLLEEQRARVFQAFAPEEGMRLYGRGIRRRLAPMLGGNRAQIELAYSLMFTLPGTPVIRYGDELNMGEDLALPERDAVRTAMQWSEARNGGFSLARSPEVPSIASGSYGYERVNMAEQRRDPESFLNWMERIIRMYKECPEFAWGDWQLLETGAGSVLGLQYNWRANSMVALHNVAPEPASVDIDVDHPRGDRLVNLLSEDHSRSRTKHHRIRLEAYGYRWFRVGAEVDALTGERFSE